MFTTYQPKTRIFAMAVLVWVAMLVTACGPADQSVQERIGNLPAPPQQEDTAEPTAAPVATATPEPRPTSCDVPDTDVCFEDPGPPPTPEYEHLRGELGEIAKAAEKTQRANRGKSDAPKANWIAIYVGVESEEDLDTLYEWLDGQEDVMGLRKSYGEFTLNVAVTVRQTLLIPIAQREEVLWMMGDFPRGSSSN